MTRRLTEDDVDGLLLDARAYRSVAIVRAKPLDADAGWQTRAGDHLEAKAGDWWVTDGDERWSVAADVFDETYEHLGSDRFRKRSEVSAAQVHEAFEVTTLEGVSSGRPGDWLVRNPGGDCYPVADDVFSRKYEPA